MLVISWIILFAVGVACLYLPYVHWYYWRGGWRWLALVPLLLPLGYIIVVVSRMLSASPDHSINALLLLGLVGASLLLSLGLRAWHKQRGTQGRIDRDE